MLREVTHTLYLAQPEPAVSRKVAVVLAHPWLKKGKQYHLVA